MERESLIDIKTGKIEKNECCTVYLKGMKAYEDNCYIENLKLVTKDSKGVEKEYDLKLSGYGFKLYLAPFIEEDKDDILVYGNSTSNGKCYLINIYTFKDDKLMEVLNSDKFCEIYKYTARYLENYKVELICSKSEKKHVIDVSDINEGCIREIYDLDGKIIYDKDPEVSYIKEIIPISLIDENLYIIETSQDINVGFNKVKVATVRNTITFKSGKAKVISQYIKKEGRSISSESIYINKKEELIRMIPEGSILLNFNRFGGSNGVIKSDVDGDGNDEIICGYKKDDIQYLAVFREKDKVIKYVDSIEGPGYDISDLALKKVKVRGNDSIIIGWKIGAIWSVLDILELKDDKLVRVLKGDKINYSKIYFLESEAKGNTIDLAIWAHETGEAYNIQIYSLKGDRLEKNVKGNKEYFEKVEEYYKDLINKSRETPQYLYYLIDSQYRAGKKREAIENINKAMKHEKPYPSLQELKRLKKYISR